MLARAREEIPVKFASPAGQGRGVREKVDHVSRHAAIRHAPASGADRKDSRSTAIHMLALRFSWNGRECWRRGELTGACFHAQFRENLPFNFNGKIDRQALKPPAGAG